MGSGRFFLGILCFWALTLPADAGDITIANVDVAVHGVSPNQAKETAINMGHEKAFQVLHEHYPALANLKPSIDVIMGLVSGFNVNKEHIGPNVYKATMTFHFAMDAIEHFLKPQDKPVAMGSLLLPPSPQVGLHEKVATIPLTSMDEWTSIQTLLTSAGYKITPTILTREGVTATLVHPLPYAAWPGVLRTAFLEGKEVSGVFLITKAPR